MSNQFKELVADLNRMVASGQYSKRKAWDEITKRLGSKYRKGLVRVEDNCVLLSLIDPDGNNYLYWNCFDGQRSIQHELVVPARGKEKEKPKISFLKHLEGGPTAAPPKLKFLDIDALPLPNAASNRNIHYHFDPKNPIEEHARPANTNVTYTPLRHDFVETPEISSGLP